MKLNLKIVSTAALCALLAGCSTVSNTAQRIWPFGNDDNDRQAVASDGERVSILQFEDSVEVSSELAGRAFNLPTPRAVTAWPEPGGTAENSIEHAQAGEQFRIAWRHDIGEGSGRTTQVTSPIVASDGRLYVLDGHNQVSAVDAASGRTVWRYTVTNSERDRGGLLSFGRTGGQNQGFGGGLAVGGDRVFVTSGLRVVTALNAATGDVIWTSEVESPIHSAPTVAGNRVYAVDIDNQIIAFDVTTGNQNWSYQAIAEPARILRASSPAVSGEVVIAPFSSGELVALRTSNGQMLWQQVLSRTNRTNALSELRDITGRPVVYQGSVYAGSHSGLFAAMDLRSGTPRWQLPIATLNAPWPAGDVVYVVSKAGEVITINRANGQVYWIYDLNEGRQRQEGGVLGMFDRTVRPIWSGPLLATNRLVLVSSEGEAVALNARTGAEEASLNLGGAAYIAPIAYNGMIYVLTDEGQLIAIQ
ncbi:PQQ-binding-like beta-propeller repeat protein [Brevundimonas aveniformis]|uniref:outer membrane protein assembly factor BamB family protein n=1 Tax=Brevundimonas aveniformis TaxID=370977 RepID=UPI0004149E17|nr:PQQ-binding-like beta-propeller repeat protein [Brevundimonas aveniformis]